MYEQQSKVIMAKCWHAHVEELKLSNEDLDSL
jgi:hypothetical protein